MEFNNYLHILARQLRLEPTREQEIVQELETHLEEETADLEAQGMGHEEALKLAIRKMGSPKAVARKLYEVHSPAVWRDILLATAPHFLLAALFALHLWSHYFLMSLLVVGITLITWRNWRRGNPSKWSYTWMGYTLAAPALSWLLSLIALSYAGWTLFTTGQLPFSTALFILLIGYVPFSMWVLANVISKVMQRDWLLASFTALPFPFLTSWVLFLNWQGGLWGTHAERIQDSDTARAFIFLALAITTAVFLKIGPRLLKIGLLTVTTAILVAVTVTALPVDFNLLALLLMILASVVFLISPAMLESQLGRRYSRRPAYQPGEEEDIASPPVP
jgi:hypothetical protein